MKITITATANAKTTETIKPAEDTLGGSGGDEEEAVLTTVTITGANGATSVAKEGSLVLTAVAKDSNLSEITADSWEWVLTGNDKTGITLTPNGNTANLMQLN